MSTKKQNRSAGDSSPPNRANGSSLLSQSSQNQNERGVLLMREGNIEEAVRVLRPLVVAPGCIWTRTDAPFLVRRNFATALLLAGQPAGCLELLAEMKDDKHARVVQLRAAIKRWEKTLSLLEWVNWRTGWIAPVNRPVAIDFLPGEISDEVVRPNAMPSDQLTSSLHQAV